MNSEMTNQEVLKILYDEEILFKDKVKILDESIPRREHCTPISKMFTKAFCPLCKEELNEHVFSSEKRFDESIKKDTIIEYALLTCECGYRHTTMIYKGQGLTGIQMGKVFGFG